MSPSDHETLWCEAPVRFWCYHKNASARHRMAHPDDDPYAKVFSWGYGGKCDGYEMERISVLSPDWKTLAQNDRVRFGSSLGNHNWWCAARIDLDYFPDDAPFIYYGRLITGGDNCTFKLRRCKSKHQASHLIPRHAALTYLGENITLAKWTERRHARYGWENRTVHRTAYLTRGAKGYWISAASPEECIRIAVLTRFNLPDAA